MRGTTMDINRGTAVVVGPAGEVRKFSASSNLSQPETWVEDSSVRARRVAISNSGDVWIIDQQGYVKMAPTTKVTAAFTLYNGSTYLFHSDGTYSRTSKGKTGIDSGYPAKMPGGWKGFPSSWYSGINAALPYQGTDKAYMFKDGKYARLKVVTVDSGYPTNMPGGWRNMPSSWNGQVDAALYYPPNGRHYMFKGDEYIRLTGVTVDSGYPAKLPGGWSGMPAEFAKGIDAATYRNGHVYMFRGSQYIRFTGTKMDAGYPKAIKGNWAEN
jgi:hypothetical protein